MRYKLSCILFLLAMTTRELAAACCSKPPAEKRLQKKLSIALLNDNEKKATAILNRNTFKLDFNVMDYYKKWDGKIAYTPLQYTIAKKHPDLALLILQKRADPTFYYAPHSPADLAAFNGYKDLAAQCKSISQPICLKKLELEIAAEINGLPEEYQEIEEKAYEA